MLPVGATLVGGGRALEGIALSTARLCDHSITLAFSSSSSCS
jgi:hypothetical protein